MHFSFQFKIWITTNIKMRSLVLQIRRSTLFYDLIKAINSVFEIGERTEKNILKFLYRLKANC